MPNTPPKLGNFNLDVVVVQQFPSCPLGLRARKYTERSILAKEVVVNRENDESEKYAQKR